MSYSETASNPACHAIQRMKASDGSFDGNSSHTKIRYQVKKGTTVTFEVAENVNGKMCGILDKSGGWSCSGNSCTKSAIVNSNTTLTALYKCNGNDGNQQCICWPDCYYYVTQYSRKKYAVCGINCTHEGSPSAEITAYAVGNGGVGFILPKYIGQATDFETSGLGDAINTDYDPKGPENCIPYMGGGFDGRKSITYPSD